MIEVTESAREQIVNALKAGAPAKEFLRVTAEASGTKFKYNMKLIPAGERTAEDSLVELGDCKIVLDPQSAQHLKGATIDFKDGLVESGFKFDNPNVPSTPGISGQGVRSDLTGPVADKVQRLLDTELNPAVAAHGGVMTLVGVKDDAVYLSFGGGCHGCGMVDVTLKQGVEVRIKEAIPEVTAVIDVTDHAAGENPFYK